MEALIKAAKVAVGLEVPKYGGTFTLAIPNWIYPFDEIYRRSVTSYPIHLTNDELLQGDWPKGLAGTGESTFSLLCPLTCVPLASTLAGTTLTTLEPAKAFR